MTTKGSLLALREEPPRMRMRLPAPGWPLLEVMRTPGVLPTMSCSGVENAPRWKERDFTLTRDPVKSFVLDWP